MSKLVTLPELIERFERANPGSFATLNLLAPVKTKKGCPVNALRKRERLTVQIGTDYSKVVQKRTSDPTFQSEAIWKGAGRLLNRYVIEHQKTHEKYLRLLLTRKIESEFLDETGCVVPKEMVESFLPKHSEPKTGVFWLTPNIKNVKSVAIGGEELILV